MKYKSMINVIAGAGLVLAPLSTMASDFGGGWVKDPNFGTIYYSNHPPVEPSPSPVQKQTGDKIGFGGGWVKNPNSGTTYYSNHPPVETSPSPVQANSDGDKIGFGGGWVKDPNSGTIYYSGHDNS